MSLLLCLGFSFAAWFLVLSCGGARAFQDTKAEVFVSTAVEEGIRYSLLQRKALKAAAATASVPTPASATATGPEAEGQQEGVVKKRESTQGASRGALEAEMARLLEKLLSTVDGFRKVGLLSPPEFASALDSSCQVVRSTSLHLFVRTVSVSCETEMPVTACRSLWCPRVCSASLTLTLPLKPVAPYTPH